MPVPPVEGPPEAGEDEEDEGEGDEIAPWLTELQRMGMAVRPVSLSLGIGPTGPIL